MKHKIIFLIGIFLWTFPVCGQGWLKNQNALTRRFAQRAEKISLSKLESSLHKQALRANQAAQALTARLTPEEQELGEYVLGVLKPESFTGSSLHKNRPQMRKNAFIESNNRHVVAGYMEFVRFLKRQKKFLPQMEENLQISSSAKLPRIPSTARYVFVGESHLKEEIQHKLEQLLKAYRAQHPDRQIIVLTEMAPDEGLSFSNRIFHYFYEGYADLFAELKKLKIPFAGLEDKAVMREERFVESFFGYELSLPISHKGLFQRNAHWVNRIHSWREKYPDAVFFIYAGNTHVDYTVPFSLPHWFNKQESFVFSLLAPSSVDQRMFHVVSKNKFLIPGALLTWKDPKWGRVAGFDAAYIIPEETR